MSAIQIVRKSEQLFFEEITKVTMELVDFLFYYFRNFLGYVKEGGGALLEWAIVWYE